MPKPTQDFRQISSETAEALTHLRQTLRQVLDRLLPEGYGARSLGRTLGLGQTTAWRCWRIAHAADAAVALPELPGRRAWDEIIACLDERGLEPGERKALREAFSRLEPIVFGRRADREALRSLAAGGLDAPGDLAAMRDLRRSATRGAAMLYGLKVKSTVLTWMVGPSTREGAISVGIAGVMDGIQRLRSGPPWPILQRSVGSEPGNAKVFCDPLGDDPRIPMLLRGYSTRGASGAELQPESRFDRETIDLGDVSAERNGRLRIVHAEIMPDAGTPQPGPPQSVALGTPILAPTESIVFHLAFHRSRRPHSEPFASLLCPPVSVDLLRSIERAVRAPLEVSMRRARGFGLPRRCAALEEGHREACRRVAAAQGVDMKDYEVHRLDLPHPPTFALIAGQFELVAAPRGKRDS